MVIYIYSSKVELSNNLFFTNLIRRITHMYVLAKVNYFGIPWKLWTIRATCFNTSSKKEGTIIRPQKYKLKYLLLFKYWMVYTPAHSFKFIYIWIETQQLHLQFFKVFIIKHLEKVIHCYHFSNEAIWNKLIFARTIGMHKSNGKISITVIIETELRYERTHPMRWGNKKLVAIHDRGINFNLICPRWDVY